MRGKDHELVWLSTSATRPSNILLSVVGVLQRIKQGEIVLWGPSSAEQSATAVHCKFTKKVLLMILRSSIRCPKCDSGK